MSLRLFQILILVGGLSLSSCQAILPQNRVNLNDVAFFLEKLKKGSAGMGMVKTVGSNGHEEKVDLTDPNFDRELAFFSKAILSEAYLQGYFSKETKEIEGQKLTIYRAVGEKPEVRLLEVRRNPEGQITGLKLATVQDNYLFQNQLNAELETTSQAGNPRLVSYRIEGRQQVLFGDPYQYYIYSEAR